MCDCSEAKIREVVEKVLAERERVLVVRASGPFPFSIQSTGKAAAEEIAEAVRVSDLELFEQIAKTYGLAPEAPKGDQ